MTGPCNCSQPFCRQPAFTMIEMLVVILIIGIIINFIVVKIDANNPLDQLKAEARRFTSLTELATEEALLRSALIGIAIEEHSYQFLLFTESDWEPIQEDIFRERKLPEDIHLRLVIEDVMESMLTQENDTPDIILLPSGEITPFELEISSQLIDDSYRVGGDETGTLHLDHVSRE